MGPPSGFLLPVNPKSVFQRLTWRFTSLSPEGDGEGDFHKTSHKQCTTRPKLMDG